MRKSSSVYDMQELKSCKKILNVFSRCYITFINGNHHTKYNAKHFVRKTH